MTLVGFLGYIFSSFALLIFILLLLAARNNTFSGRLVLFGTIVTLGANVLSALQLQSYINLQIVLVFEAIKLLLWPTLILSTRGNITSLRALIHDKSFQQHSFLWLITFIGAWTLSFYVTEHVHYIFAFFLGFNLWQIILLEQLFRNASNKAKWALWPLVVGLGSTSIFEFVIFSQAYMINHLEPVLWYARPYILLISLPFLLISTRRIKDWSVNVFISRNVVFYSSMLFIAGGYLLVMALAGYIINFIGGEWGNFLTVIFLVPASFVLFALIITDTLRRKVKVFITKNFFANKYEYRDEWLDLIEKIETTSAESYYQMATQIMINKLDGESGAILKKANKNSFHIKFSKGLESDALLNNELLSVATFCHEKGWIIDIQEFLKTPDIYEGLAININVFIERQINNIVPIFIGKAFYGVFLIAGRHEHKQLNWEDRDLIFAISKQLGNFISLHEANDRIAESKQFDAFNRMSAFLVHDLKNVQAQLALITDNAVKHRNNPEFIDDVFETVESATKRLEKTLTQLRNKQAEQKNIEKVDLSQLIDKVVEQCNVREPSIELLSNPSCVLSIEGEKFYTVLNHLLQNAQEATKASGWVKLSLDVNDIQATVIIEDNGSGMSEDFIKHRLFKPFDTTKGNAGMGIGVFEAKQFFESNAGSLAVKSEEYQGTVFTLTLPLNRNFNQ